MSKEQKRPKKGKNCTNLAFSSNLIIGYVNTYFKQAQTDILHHNIVKAQSLYSLTLGIWSFKCTLEFIAEITQPDP
uniref:Uncharacterized protein n=1 Tax=Arundo donax TaxID=35708 RepID=A0A0A8YH70_ARUDO